jgi:hypothetical protein
MDPAVLGAMMESVANGGDRAAVLRTFAQLCTQLMSDDDDDDDGRHKLEMAKRRRRAWKRLSRLHSAMEHLSQRNAFVAGALGACECWGMNVSCEKCEGRGSAGAFEPVPEAFETLVVPLLRSRAALLREHLDDTTARKGTRDAASH